MRKLICDGCGKQIDEGYKSDWEMKPASIIRVYGKELTSVNGEMRDMEYELCSDCTNKVVTLLKNESKSEGDSVVKKTW